MATTLVLPAHDAEGLHSTRGFSFDGSAVGFLTQTTPHRELAAAERFTEVTIQQVAGETPVQVLTRAGYVLAARLLQSNISLDDEEVAARDLFLADGAKGGV
jgi:hypothetical protein